MKFRFLRKEDLSSILQLFDCVLRTTKTWGWTEGYLSSNTISKEVQSNNFVGLFDKNKLVAVSYIGDRYNPDPVKIWKEDLKNPARWAKICVHPDYQHKGVGKIFTTHILNLLKSLNYDGVRIIVAKNNIAAIKLYNKFNFVCVGDYQEFDIDWWCYELKFEGV